MIRAIRFHDHRSFRARGIAGAVFFDLTQDPVALWFKCPCGCGDVCRIPAGRNEKPILAPSWRWNGVLNDPTLTPSVHQGNCGWHGWLRDGYWESC